MAILRREAPLVAVRWTHQITSPDFVGKFSTRKERVVSAEPQIHWTMGHRFDKVRETCSMRGWELTDLRQQVAK